MTHPIQYRQDQQHDEHPYLATTYGPPVALGSTRRHLATVGALGYAVERQDDAQPLRTAVPAATRARAASVVLWCRVALALGGTVLGFTALTVLFIGLWRVAGWVSG